MNRFDVKFVVFFLILVYFSISINAQSIIHGKVEDKDFGKPLFGAKLSIKNSTIVAETNNEGIFSLTAQKGDTILIFLNGYCETQTVINSDSFSIFKLIENELLDKFLVQSYFKQKRYEITSAIVSINQKDFNKGPISNPLQLIQGRIAGVQIYNRGGNPNALPTIRIRGLSTIAANLEPLIVIDGVIGASIQNIDPDDIESIDVLKDGSATAVYGTRGSGGVINIITKSGKEGLNIHYKSKIGISGKTRQMQVMTPVEFRAAGGNDLGSETDWMNEITRRGSEMVHNIAIDGGVANTTYRISGNYRNTNGILIGSGFEQINLRTRFITKALKNKLSIDFGSSFTNRNSKLGYPEAFRYAYVYNPTAPIYGKESKTPFNAEQFGGYYETLGLFDSFNPVSIVKQNTNNSLHKEYTYGLNLSYSLTDRFNWNVRIAHQTSNVDQIQFAPITSYFRGNATSPAKKGREENYSRESEFNLVETYGTYSLDLGFSRFSITGGYSLQQNKSSEKANDIQGGFNSSSFFSMGPSNNIVAFFGKTSYIFDNAIFFNASIRREGSVNFKMDNRLGFFPSLSTGIDLNKYLNISKVTLFKLRIGYAEMGILPGTFGIINSSRTIIKGTDGVVISKLNLSVDEKLKSEVRHELNSGIDFGIGKIKGNLDVYHRKFKNFIYDIPLNQSQFQINRIYINGGRISLNGMELYLEYNVFKSSNSSYFTGLILSKNKTIINDYIEKQTLNGSLGGPGQNGTNVILNKLGQQIGIIWGPVFDGVDERGAPKFKDLNGDGKIVAAQDKALAPDADFKVLGKGLPTFELGWTNVVSFGGFTVSTLFRGAFGHSLVNSFRAFYEPQIPIQSSYNYINTRLKVDGLKVGQFSSLYVEKADFFTLDNISISKRINLKSNKIKDLNISVTGNNLFVISSYTGSNPEPALFDTEGFGVLTPGIDRRSNFLVPRIFALCVDLKF